MQIALSRNSWHYRLQYWMFDVPPDFDNFCPYFWLTIFALIASPIALTGKTVVRFVKWIPTLFKRGASSTSEGWDWMSDAVEAALDVVDRFFCVPLERATLPAMSNKAVLDLYWHSSDRFKDDKLSHKDAFSKLLSHFSAWGTKEQKKMKRSDAKFQLWKKVTGSSWMKAIEEFIKAQDEREAKEAAAAVAKMKAAEKREKDNAVRRKKLLLFFVSATKVVVKIVVIALALLIGYASYYLGLFLFNVAWVAVFWAVVNWCSGLAMGIWQFLKDCVGFVRYVLTAFSGGELGFMLMLPFIGLAVVKLLDKCDLTFPKIIWEKIVNVFDWAEDKFQNWVVMPVKVLACFLGEGFMMWKKDHCPVIKWSE